MRVLGVDPGTQKMGVGCIDVANGTLTPVYFETVRLKAKHHLHTRLQTIYESIIDTCERLQPDVLALEDIFYGASFRSAVRIGEARCAIILAATKMNIPVAEYLPTRVKKAVCGTGQAAKVQVQNMVRHILALKELPEQDAADALAIAICHSHNKPLVQKESND